MPSVRRGVSLSESGYGTRVTRMVEVSEYYGDGLTVGSTDPLGKGLDKVGLGLIAAADGRTDGLTDGLAEGLADGLTDVIAVGVGPIE